jgi:hypothetical protein
MANAAAYTEKQSGGPASYGLLVAGRPVGCAETRVVDAWHAGDLDRAGYRVRVEIIGGDEPAYVAFIEEWPSFALIGSSVLDVLHRLDVAMTGWSSMQVAAGRSVPPPRRPRVVPPRRSTFSTGTGEGRDPEPGAERDPQTREVRDQGR